MDRPDLLAVFESLGQPRVLVVGDLILDRYIWGNAERVSQEAPVLLLRADRREARLGGAANVCHMLRGLEAQVTCAGVVGDDEAGQTTIRLLAEAGIDPLGVFVDPSRPTTVKERFIGRAQGRHPHQILRVDSETREPIHAELERRMHDALVGIVEQFDILLISDYDKGVCTAGLLNALIAAARQARRPVLVDPARGQDYARYRGATSMTPNRIEAELATGIRIERTEDAFAAGRQLCRDLQLESAIVTLDRDGMALVESSGRAELFGTQPRAVYDITGAGDMVLAMIGLCLAQGVAPAQAVRLGNVAGGLEVEKVGVAVIPRGEIRQRLASESPQSVARQSLGKLVNVDQLASAALAERSQGRRIVFTNGCFDLLHVGHITNLQEAASLGDVLVVGVNSDAGVRRLKGPARPVIGERDRAAMLAALACVNYVVVFDEDTPLSILERLRPDVLVKGGTYAPHEIVGYELVTSYGGQVCVTGMVDGISTTRLLESLVGKPPVPSPHFSLTPTAKSATTASAAASNATARET